MHTRTLISAHNIHAQTHTRTKTYTHASRFLYNNPDALILFSAGNKGDGPGIYDIPFTIGNGGAAKNSLVVGSSEAAESYPQGPTLRLVCWLVCMWLSLVNKTKQNTQIHKTNTTHHTPDPTTSHTTPCTNKQTHTHTHTHKTNTTHHTPDPTTSHTTPCTNKQTHTHTHTHTKQTQHITHQIRQPRILLLTRTNGRRLPFETGHCLSGTLDRVCHERIVSRL
jgi:hypothetical protein